MGNPPLVMHVPVAVDLSVPPELHMYIFTKFSVHLFARVLQVGPSLVE